MISSISGNTTVTVNGTLQLTATVSPSNASNKNVTWSSSDKSKATVSSSGVVTGKAAGSATITVTSSADNMKSATKTVTVTASAAVTNELTDQQCVDRVKSKVGSAIASTGKDWYKSPFNRFSSPQCTWYAHGRAGEDRQVRLSFSTSSGNHGGWWIEHFNASAEKWDANCTEKISDTTVTKVTDKNNIKSRSVISWRYVNTKDKYRKDTDQSSTTTKYIFSTSYDENKSGWFPVYGHVAYIEAVEFINGSPSNIYYSEGYDGSNLQGIIRKIDFSSIATYASKYPVAKALNDTSQLQGYIQFN